MNRKNFLPKLKKFLTSNDICICYKSPNPILYPYILFFRQKVGVLNVNLVSLQFYRALNLLFKIASLKKEKNIIILGCPKVLETTVSSYCQQNKLLFVNPKKWPVGSITNKEDKRFWKLGKFKESIDLIVIYDLIECKKFLSELINMGIPMIFFTSGNTDLLSTVLNIKGGFYYPVFLNNYSLKFCFFFYKKILSRLIEFQNKK